MKNITNTENLALAIKELENRQVYELIQLKNDLQNTLDYFKPSNLIKNTIHDLTSSPKINNQTFRSIIGLGVGYLVGKIINKSNQSPINKAIQQIIQIGITRIDFNKLNEWKSEILNYLRRKGNSDNTEFQTKTQ